MRPNQSMVDAKKIMETLESKDLLVINLGGTISGKRNEQGRVDRLKGADIIGELDHAIQSGYTFDFWDEMLLENSSDLDPDTVWYKLSKQIFESRNRYKGVVIAHGANTASDTATALNFAFGPELDIPIVVVASQRHFGRVGSDAKRNVENAVTTAMEAYRQRLGEVFLLPGEDEVFRGCRGIKNSDSWFPIFQSPAAPPLAKITAHEIEFESHARKLRGDNDLVLSPSQPYLRSHFAMENVFTLRIHTGTPARALEVLLNDQDCKGIILYGFERGNVPNRFIPGIERAITKGVPIAVSTYFSEKRFRGQVPREDQNALQAGAVSAGDMTEVAAVIKFAHLLRQEDTSSSVELFNRAYTQDYVGEITIVPN